jgi:hypothetical protein
MHSRRAALAPPAAAARGRPRWAPRPALSRLQRGRCARPAGGAPPRPARTLVRTPCMHPSPFCTTVIKSTLQVAPPPGWQGRCAASPAAGSHWQNPGSRRAYTELDQGAAAPGAAASAWAPRASAPAARGQRGGLAGREPRVGPGGSAVLVGRNGSKGPAALGMYNLAWPLQQRPRPSAGRGWRRGAKRARLTALTRQLPGTGGSKKGGCSKKRAYTRARARSTRHEEEPQGPTTSAALVKAQCNPAGQCPLLAPGPQARAPAAEGKGAATRRPVSKGAARRRLPQGSGLAQGCRRWGPSQSAFPGGPAGRALAPPRPGAAKRATEPAAPAPAPAPAPPPSPRLAGACLRR